jgi:hypothetical protein
VVQLTWTDPAAAVGGLASKVTPSTVSVELPLMVDELRAPTTPVKVAAAPLPKGSLQSFFSFDFLRLAAAVGSWVAAILSALAAFSAWAVCSVLAISVAAGPCAARRFNC